MQDEQIKEKSGAKIGVTFLMKVRERGWLSGRCKLYPTNLVEIIFGFILGSCNFDVEDAKSDSKGEKQI